MFNPGTFLLAFLPLNFLSLFKICPLDREVRYNNKNTWFLGFFLSLFAMFPAFGVYVFFLQYLIWTGVYIFLYWLINKKKIISRFSFKAIIFYALIIFANLWWFIPAFLNIKDAYSGASSFGTTFWFDKGFKEVELLNLIRGIGSALMVNNKFSWNWLYSNQWFTFPLFIFPLLFLVSLRALKDKLSKNLLLFLLGVTLVSIFIMKFSNPPLSWILGFAFHYVPFFGGFRDSIQKVGPYFYLGYITFIAIGIISVWKFFRDRRLKLAPYVFVIILVLASVILSGPYFLFRNDNIRTENFSFQGRDYSIKAKTSVPPEYLALKKFLETKCNGDTVMEIPRSGFVTNAIWEKYGTSYAGQDILPGLISCNFLTTASFNTNSETAIQVPYLFLEKNDLTSFKNYLNQNGIKYILLRHDFVPENLVTWTYVNPTEAEKMLTEDKDFKLLYKNDLLTVLEKENIKPKQYGFALTDNAVYLPSPIKDGLDYAGVSKILGNDGPLVLLDNKSSQNEFKEKANSTVISANCIGCIKINPKSTIFEGQDSLWTKFKDFIKKFLKKQVNQTEDAHISLDILSVHKIFANLIDTVKNENQNNFSKLIEENKIKWLDVEKEISDYKTDRFTKNNKYIEATNFLSIESNTSFNYLTSQSFKRNKFLNKPKNRQEFQAFVQFENRLLRRLSKNITETNFSNKSYIARLDVPSTGGYTCEVSQRDNGATVNSVTLEDKGITKEQYQGLETLSLNEGSYILNIKYDLKSLFKKKLDKLKVGQFYPVKIGFLNQGKYNLSFTIPTGYEGRILVAISQGKLTTKKLEDLSADPKSSVDVRSFDIIQLDYNNSNNFHRIFNIDAPEEGNYYVYFYFIGPNTSDVQIKNLKVESYVDGLYFRFICLIGNKHGMNKTEILINKKSQTYYSIVLPKNYKGFLTFNQTFDKAWIAHSQNSTNIFPHFKTGYSNGWYIDNLADSRIIIEFKTQKEIEIAGLLSIIAFIAIVVIYIHLK